jgi:hypothetical protein
MQDWSDLVVHAPPLYIQEKIHPKVLIDDLNTSLPMGCCFTDNLTGLAFPYQIGAKIPQRIRPWATKCRMWCGSTFSAAAASTSVKKSGVMCGAPSRALT